MAGGRQSLSTVTSKGSPLLGGGPPRLILYYYLTTTQANSPSAARKIWGSWRSLVTTPQPAAGVR